MLVSTSVTQRPRNVSALQAAAILYGDWGTSKAYVIGLAFAISTYSSFWLIAAVSVFMILVSLNYITICEFNPFGGGAYASARRQSEVLALIGAFFLIADYLITASLSALSCFSYMGVAYPAMWAIVSILFVGLINFFGPRHTGNLAFLFALPTIISVIILTILGLPYIQEAIQHVEPLKGGFLLNWEKFVGIIVALSGIESIANTTGVMKLDPGTTEDNPSVYRTSRKAIIWVMVEVCIFTTLLGLLMLAIPGLTVVDGNVNAPDESNIRDAMLRYMGYFFGSRNLDPMWGDLIAIFVSASFGALLLSAVNTAIVALVSLMFVMSRDGEMLADFQKLNRFGVPIYPLILATIFPMIVLVFVNDVASLVDLYAVGFVGAIATNLGVNAYDKTIPMTRKERYLMWVTFIIMIFVEMTLFFIKPNARRFAIYILAGGLVLRAFVIEQRQKQWATKKVKLRHASLYSDDTRVPLHYGAFLCAVKTIGKTLNFALQEAKHYEQPVYILFVREQQIITEEDRSRTWLDDDDACRIFDYAKESSHEITIKFFYAISNSPAETIADMAKDLHVSRVILGRPRQSAMIQLLRGNIVQEVSEILSPQIDLLVIS